MSQNLEIAPTITTTPYGTPAGLGRAVSDEVPHTIDQAAHAAGSSPLFNWTIWGASFAVWTVLAFLLVCGSRLYAMVAGFPSPSIALLLTWDLSDAYTWAFLTPLIYALSKRFSFDRNFRAALLFHLPVSGLLAFAGAVATVTLIYVIPWSRNNSWAPLKTQVVGLFLGNVPRYCLIVAVSEAINYYNKYREREFRSAQLELQLASAQLQALKMQLEPHFLFNVLNSIAALARKDGIAAERMTLQLADLLRISLQHVELHEVPLRQELEFLDCYLCIQQTRFHDRLSTRFAIAPEVMEASVPHLVLQPLVENAIRHGISPRSTPGWVEVHAHRQEERLVLEILDNGVGLTRNGNPLPAEGVGLKNTRARLQQLYGDNYVFTCENASGGGCRVRIVVPFRAAALAKGGGDARPHSDR